MLFRSIELLAGGCEGFRRFCIEGLEPDLPRIEALLGGSLMLVTALTPAIGYDRAAAIAEHAHSRDLTLRQAALELGHLSGEAFDELVRPERMV